MGISWIKYEKDKESFRLQEALGLNVLKLENLENADKTIQNLVDNDCKTIIISNDVASFSEDIIKKYQKKSDVKIVISIDKDIL